MMVKSLPYHINMTHSQALILTSILEYDYRIEFIYNGCGNKIQGSVAFCKRKPNYILPQNLTHVKDNHYILEARSNNYNHQARDLFFTIDKKSEGRLFQGLNDAIKRAQTLNPICINPFDPEQKSRRRIVTAAVKRIYKDGFEFVYISARHFSTGMHPALNIVESIHGKYEHEVQGFIDQFDHFWDRKDALIIASTANQLNQYREKHCTYSELYSEDLH